VSGLTWGMAAHALSVPVAGVKVIELVARAPGGDNQRLPVAWGEAALMEH
jgi:alpha-galactosidase